MPTEQSKKRPPSTEWPADALFRKLFWIIPILTFVAYAGILGQQYLNFDDDWYIYESPYASGIDGEKISTSFTGQYMGQYSPLPQLFLAILHQAGGGSPFLLKLFAVLFHILNTFLVFRLITKITGKYHPAFFVAALFALHPVQVESVAWLTEVFKISACFSLLAMLLYLRFLDTRKPLHYVGVILLFVLSFLSREQAVLLTISFVLIDYVRKRHLLSKQVILEKIPFAAMSIIFGVITLRLVGSHHSLGQHDMLPGHKIYLLALAIGTYVKNLLFPAGLSFSYLQPIFGGGLTSAQVAIVAVVFGGLAAALWLARKSRLGMFGLLFWLGNMSLSLLFVVASLRDTFMADRYLYLASVGFFLALWMLLDKLLANRPPLQRPVRILVGVGILGLAAMTFQRTAVFADPITLWTDVIHKDQRNYYAYNSRAMNYTEAGDLQNAARDFQAAVQANPDFALAYYSLGELFFRAGDMDEALRYTNLAIQKFKLTARSEEAMADLLSAHNNRAAMLINKQMYAEALPDLDLVLSRQPDRVDALTNRTIANYNVKAYAKSLADIETLLRIDPRDSRALNYSGMCHGQMGDFNRAISAFSRAIEINPREAGHYLNRAWAYEQAGQFEKALADAERGQQLGAQLRPGYLDRLRAGGG